MSVSKRTKFGALLAGSTLAFSLAACGGGDDDSPDGSSGGETPTIKVQTYPGIWTNALVWIAQEKGFYEEQGINVEAVEVATGPQGIAALQSGSIHLSQNTSDNLVVSAATGIDVQAVVGNFGNMYTLMAASKLDIPAGYPASVQALDGMRIGITAPGASTDMLARATVTDAGLDEDAVEYVAVGGTAGQVTALEAGVVEAVVAMTPQDSVFESTGDAESIVAYADGEGPAAVKDLNACFQVYFGMRDWVGDNEETLKKFSAAQAAAAEWANDAANFDELVELLHEKSPLNAADDPLAVAKTAAQKMVDAGQLTAAINGDCISNWSTFLLDNGVIDDEIDGNDLVWAGAEQ